MNPIGLLLIAMVAGGGRSPAQAPAPASSLQLDSLLSTLHSTVNTLEKVNQITQMSVPMHKSMPLPAPDTNDVSTVESIPGDTPSSPLGNIDLQSAMQTLGPIISMLSNSQNSK